MNKLKLHLTKILEAFDKRLFYYIWVSLLAPALQCHLTRRRATAFPFTY